MALTETLTRFALAPVMRVWLASARSGFSALPRPRDAPRAHSAGFDSDRVLIFGSGPAVGWGVITHELALPGALARALSARTGRGADVELVADGAITVATAARELATIKLGRFDAIVVVLGVNDALRLTSVSAWSRRLAGLLAVLEQRSAASASIFVCGVHPIRSLPMFDSKLGAVADANARAMNRVSAQLCSGLARTIFVPLPAAPPTTPSRYRDGGSYQFWSDVLTEEMAPVLDASRSRPDPEADPYVAVESAEAEAVRQVEIARLGIVDAGPEERFDRIVEQAQKFFGTSGAAFNLVVDGVLVPKSQVGESRAELQLARSFSALAMASRGAVIIGDARLDERFKRNPFVVSGGKVRFWAGFPIECVSGERIGTLSVFDSSPRSGDPEWDRPVLRQLALQIQDELRRTTPTAPERR